MEWKQIYLQSESVKGSMCRKLRIRTQEMRISCFVQSLLRNQRRKDTRRVTIHRTDFLFNFESRERCSSISSLFWRKGPTSTDFRINLGTATWPRLHLTEMCFLQKCTQKRIHWELYGAIMGYKSISALKRELMKCYGSGWCVQILWYVPGLLAAVLSVSCSW